MKESEKTEKSSDLTRELKKRLNMKIVIPIEFTAFRTFPRYLEWRLEIAGDQRKNQDHRDRLEYLEKS